VEDHLAESPNSEQSSLNNELALVPVNQQRLEERCTPEEPQVSHNGGPAGGEYAAAAKLVAQGSAADL